VDESSHPTMLDHAHAAIVTVTGRQIPVPLEGSASALLTALWAAGLRFGVQPGDWQATTSLPTACLDALIIVERRRS
jgi:hypothetical protein